MGQKVMLHVNYHLFSSVHMYSELGSLMWPRFDVCPQGLDALLGAGRDDPAKSQPEVVFLSLPYILTPSNSEFSV